MASQQTVEAVKRILRDCLRLGADAAIADDMPLVGGSYDLDSLDTLLILTTVEKEFGIKLADGNFDRSSLANVTTFADLIESRVS